MTANVVTAARSLVLLLVSVVVLVSLRDRWLRGGAAP